MDNEEFRNYVREFYWNRKDESIKSDFGKSLLIGTSRCYPNALTVAARLSACSGNGYTALSVPEINFPIVFSRISPLMIGENLTWHQDELVLDENLSQASRYDSVLFGNGMAVTKQNFEALEVILKNLRHNLIIDAGGIRMLSKFGSDILLKRSKGTNVLLTPHLGEAKELLFSDIKSRNPKDYEKDALDYAKKYQVSLLLKSGSSLLVLPDGRTYMSDYLPTPSLARAGSGDALAGYLAGLLAYGEKIVDFPTVVRFGDEMIHRAAKKRQEQISSGLSSAEELPDAIRDIVVSYQ